MKTILILSGGLDSTTLLYDLIDQGKEVYPISFNYGQRHSKELEQAKINCKELGLDHKIIDLTSITSLINNCSLAGDIDVPNGPYTEDVVKLTNVPNRNMIMVSIAVGYAINIGANTVYYGAHADDHLYPDCREEFIRNLNKATEVCHHYPIYVFAPYLNMDKGDIVKKGLELGVPYENTWSCYKGGENPCGRCPSCITRREAFEKNGVKDPVEYEE